MFKYLLMWMKNLFYFCSVKETKTLLVSNNLFNTSGHEKCNIDWIFFSPAGTLEPGKRTGKFRLGKDDLIVDENGNSHISVEDYAVAMVDELENPKRHYERFTIGY